MKKLTKVENVCLNKKVCLGAGLLAGVAVLAWAWWVTTRPGVGVIDFGAGATHIAHFVKGAFVGLHTINIGGNDLIP